MRKRSQPVPPPAPEPEKFERWIAQRKVAIILDVLKGKISVPEAARKRGFAQSEFREWTEEYHRAGVDALKVNKKGLEAEYRTEVKRLQAKIGELAMENETRKEAMRPFTSVEPMFPALCSTRMAKSRDLPDPRRSGQHGLLSRARSCSDRR
jgi:transposase-like protein